VSDQTEGATSAPEAAPEGAPAIPESIAPYVSELRSEAAAHRVKAREAEQALTAANERVTAMQRAEAERLATTLGFEQAAREHRPGGESGTETIVLAQAADLWLGRDLADVLDEHGNVDPEKVSAAVSSLVTERPGMGVSQGLVSISGGMRRESPADRRQPSFGEALSKAVRRER
jgi:hypothetical protein